MLLELHGFSGRTEVLGFVREVAFANGVLSIGGFDLAEANRILKALETGRLIGVEPASNLTDGARPAGRNGAAAPVGVAAPSESTPAAPPESATPAVEVPPAPAPDDPDAARVEKFGKATQFKHIVGALAADGLDEKGIVETCLRIKSKVPLLARMEGIERRVPITLAAMGK